MKNLFSIFKIKEQKRFLVLDFGKGSVKGIIFQPCVEKIKILKFQEQRIQRFGVFDGKEFELDVVKKATDKVIKNLEDKEKILNLPKILSFSPDILRAKVFNVSLKRKKKNEKISNKEKEEIYASIFNYAKKELFKEEGDDVHILKKKIIAKRISGYKVPSILELNGEKLDVKILIIFASKHYFEFLSLLQNELNLIDAEIFHQVESLIKYASSLGNNKNKVFIDIGEKNTLISYFKDEIEFVNDFQIGGYDFTKQLADKLNIRENDARTIKEDFSVGALTSETQENLKQIMLPILDLWQKNFKEAIADKLKFASPEIYIFGGTSLFPFIKKAVNKEINRGKISFLLPENLFIYNKTPFKFSAKDTPSLLLTLIKKTIK